MFLAAAASAEGTGLLCGLLLIATIIAFIIGFAEALGLTNFTDRGGRYGALILAVILLVVYLVLC